MVARGIRGDGERKGLRLAGARARGLAGFTVIEILVVVLIVTLLAAIALPGIAKRAIGNRARGITQEVASAYRSGRLNALGRGAATLVRYDQVAGTVTILEAIQGPAAAQGPLCATMPVNSCTTAMAQWDPASTTHQTLSTIDITGGGDFTSSMLFRDVTGAAASPAVIEICFTPAGRTFVRGGAATAASSTFAPMAGSARVAITDPNGIIRYAAIPPNGAARTMREQ